MYLQRLLKYIGVDGEIVKNDYILGNKFDINLYGCFVKTYREENCDGATEYLYIPLSDILIKNIDKIRIIYEKANEGGNYQYIEYEIIDAIKNGTEEEFAKSLYNNK